MTKGRSVAMLPYVRSRIGKDVGSSKLTLLCTAVKGCQRTLGCCTLQAGTAPVMLPPPALSPPPVAGLPPPPMLAPPAGAMAPMTGSALRPFGVVTRNVDWHADLVTGCCSHRSVLWGNPWSGCLSSDTGRCEPPPGMAYRQTLCCATSPP